MNALLGWIIAGALVLAGISGFIGYQMGQGSERTRCERDTAQATIEPAQKLAKRDAAVDAIGADTAQQRDTVTHDLTSRSHAAQTRIVTVEVPGDCTRVPDGIVREHDASRTYVNTQIRGGVRPTVAGTGAPGPDDAP